MNRSGQTEKHPPLHSRRLGRELAMEFLFSCELQNSVPGAAAFALFLEAAKDELQIRDNHLMHRAEEYAKKLYESVALNREKIDSVIRSHCENWDWDRISYVDRNIMRVAVAEMFDFSEVPVIVSIDEAVEIARDFSGADAGNFINGMLNSIKEREFRERKEAEKR